VGCRNDSRLTRVHHGSDALVEHRLVELVGMPGARTAVPSGVLGVNEHVLGVRERRDPVPVNSLGVPSAVIVVQVRADHEVDGVGGRTGRSKPFQVGKIELVESGYRARASVAVARVHQDGALVDPKDPAVVRELEGHGRRIEVTARERRDPAGDERFVVGQQREGNRELLLLDSVHRRGTDAKRHPSNRRLDDELLLERGHHAPSVRCPER
jgi:hypothetical protein